MVFKRLLLLGLVAAMTAGAILWWYPNAWYAIELASSPSPTELPSPVEGVAARTIVDSWGNPRSGARRHEGIDIFAPRGRPVVSTTPGIVWRVGENGLGGRVVWVLGPGRQLHYYAHLDAFAPIRQGDRVDPGTRLGFVGDSGNARGGATHLHYGIYPMGARPINPSPRLRAGGEPAATRVSSARVVARPRDAL
jgi:murein DD-endopeptidase MepM/ murein hydrolase activator NlpD